VRSCRVCCQWIAGLGWSPLAVLLTIVFLYLVLGCVMDALAMILVCGLPSSSPFPQRRPGSPG